MSKQMQQNLIAVAMFLAMLLFVYFKYLISPLNMKYNESFDQLKTAESKLTEMKRRARELPKLQAEMKYLEEEVASLGKRIPKEKDIQQLLRIVSKTAQNYNLDLSNFSPSGIVDKTNYFEIPFRVTVKGNYHSIAQFLADIGQVSRIISSRDLRITAVPGEKTDKTMTVNMQIIAYTIKE